MREAVRMQEAIGLQSATDGELRRGSWHMDFIYQLGGVEKLASDLASSSSNRGGVDRLHAGLDARRRAGAARPHDLRRRLHVPARHASRRPLPKLTIPSPSMVHYRGGRAAIDETVYPDLDAFWADLTAAYRDEITRLGELGCRYLQLDDTSLAYLNDPDAARARRRDRRRPRAPARGLHPPPQRRHREPARGHADHDAHVPRQLPLLLVRLAAATTTSPRCCSTS